MAVDAARYGIPEIENLRASLQSEIYAELVVELPKRCEGYRGHEQCPLFWSPAQPEGCQTPADNTASASAAFVA